MYLSKKKDSFKKRMRGSIEVFYLSWFTAPHIHKYDLGSEQTCILKKTIPELVTLFRLEYRLVCLLNPIDRQTNKSLICKKGHHKPY